MRNRFLRKNTIWHKLALTRTFYKQTKLNVRQYWYEVSAKLYVNTEHLQKFFLIIIDYKTQ